MWIACLESEVVRRGVRAQTASNGPKHSSICVRYALRMAVSARFPAPAEVPGGANENQYHHRPQIARRLLRMEGV